jgi:hypothetical protein
MAIPRLTLPRPHEAQAISVIAPTQRAIHWGHFRAVARVAAAFFTLLMTGVKAQSQTVPLPDVVKLPAGLNLGGTSFYDGFGRTDPGWIFLDYARWNHLTSVKDNYGDNSPSLPVHASRRLVVSFTLCTSRPSAFQTAPSLSKQFCQLSALIPASIHPDWNCMIMDGILLI